MNWTSEKPTVSGRYWHRENQDSAPEVIEVWCEGNHVFFMGTNISDALDNFGGQFLGPIYPQEDSLTSGAPK